MCVSSSKAEIPPFALKAVFISFNVKTFHHLRIFVGKYKYKTEEPHHAVCSSTSAAPIDSFCRVTADSICFPLFQWKKNNMKTSFYLSLCNARAKRWNRFGSTKVCFFFSARALNGHRQRWRCAHKTRTNTKKYAFSTFSFRYIFFMRKVTLSFLAKGRGCIHSQ